MMKRTFLFVLAIGMLFSPAALAQDARPPLRLGGAVFHTDYWAAHAVPTASPGYGWDGYGTIARSENAPDLFGFQTSRDDFAAAKAAGLLADLGGSGMIREWTERLRPDIQSLVTTGDGKIVGLAEYAFLLPLYWRQDAWDAAGLTAADVPQSYTELLDFLERWITRIGETPDPAVCIADTRAFAPGGPGYVRWLLDLLISTWEMQQYHAGEPLDFNTPVFVALLERTRELGLRLDAAEPNGKKRQATLPLFENYSGGERYNAGRSYGLSHTVPFRITADQPALMRATATISVVRAGSPWTDAIIGRLEYGLASRAPRGEGNADLLTDVRPRTHNPEQAGSPATVTAGYLADLDSYAGTICFAPMLTIEMYEAALAQFVSGQLPAQALAEQISIPKRDPNQ